MTRQQAMRVNQEVSHTLEMLLYIELSSACVCALFLAQHMYY